MREERKVIEINEAEADRERDLLITFPSQDGEQCFVGWDVSCQDDPMYNSPLGGLPCSDYANTQCVLFRHVGFNEEQMHEFINSCPCSCGIGELVILFQLRLSLMHTSIIDASFPTKLHRVISLLPSTSILIVDVHL